MRLRSCFAGVTLPLLAGVLLAAPAPIPGPPRMINIERYQISFDERFDHLDVSAWGPGTRWIAHTPWHGDFGDAHFIDPEGDQPFKTEGGLLTITMTRRAGVWQSGLLSSADSQSRGFTQSGGYYEVRAKLPGGAGVWPAIWLGSNAQDGKSNPEIDILEYYGHDPSAYMATVHVWHKGQDVYGKGLRIPVLSGALEAGFHRFGVSIDETSVIFYLDRREVGRVPSRPEYLHPMYLMIDLGAGGGWPITSMPDPSIMVVDYARAYRLRSSAKPTPNSVPPFKTGADAP